MIKHVVHVCAFMLKTGTSMFRWVLKDVMFDCRTTRVSAFRGIAYDMAREVAVKKATMLR